MNINRLVIFCSLSFLFSVDNLDINYLSDDLFSNSIYLDLESHNKTGYLFDKYHPYRMNDSEYLNFKIDGSMMYPILNSIPKQIFLNKTDTTSMSQLSIIQDHSNRYYDTGVALKTYLRKDVNVLVQGESKSIYGNNYSQKFITSFYKNTENLELDVGYMYNQDDVLTYLESSDSNRGIESFSSKLYMKYKGIPGMTILNHFNSQISNYNRFYSGNPIQYLSETNWNTLLINYIFGITHLEFKSNYKYTISDSDDQDLEQFFLNNNYHHLSLALKSFINKHSLEIGIDDYNGISDYFFNYKFDFKNFSFGAYLSNDVFFTVDNLDMKKIISTTRKIKLDYQNDSFTQSFIIGENSNESDFMNAVPNSYSYYLYEAGIKYDWLNLHLNYGKYDSDELYIKNYMSLSFIISPKLGSKRFRPYCKSRISSIGINNNYSISNEGLDLIEESDSIEESDIGITVVDGEFGFLFNHFKVAFIKENMLKDGLYYSGNTSYYNVSKYLINITWIFED